MQSLVSTFERLFFGLAAELNHVFSHDELNGYIEALAPLGLKRICDACLCFKAMGKTSFPSIEEFQQVIGSI